MKAIKPYGSWSSELTADILANKGKRYGHMDLDNGCLYWLEVRASEKGRGVLVKCNPDNSREEVLPANISVRTKVHEYGGGDFLVSNGKVYFSNADDNRVYVFDDEIKAVTPIDINKKCRYADFCVSPNGDYLFAVRETHHNNQVTNELVCIFLQEGTVQVVDSNFEFYSFPRVTKAGNRICWTCWNRPDMPWDSAELWLADLHSDGSVDAKHHVTGGDSTCIFQPEWGFNGVLHYISDASGWSNIYSHRDGILNALTPIDRDFSVPQWVFGLGTYVINADGTLYALNFEAGQQQLNHIDPKTGHIEPIPLPFKQFSGPLLGDENSLYFCAAGPAVEVAMYRYDIQSKKCFLLSETSSFALPVEDISVAQPIQFKSEAERQCFAFYYPPKNAAYEAPENTYPPLIVMSHGGPTSYCENSLDAGVQFWTNRGFAVVDVNYSGSTGYGKKYRERLTGQWGVVDVEDCVAAAKYLVEKKLACAKSLLIRGGSAGGYTTLCALTFTDVFAAGMSRYGVADLESLASDSHKFESRYLDKIVGPYPEAKALYQERSPIHFTNKLSCPVLLLQGADDKVVPPNQAEAMVEALDKKKLPYAYILFDGEGHGFRQASTIIKAFNAELDFYRQILGIKSDEDIETLKINNLG
ncbi:prolyl oligopeptidase family serine peptidase [Aliikangiella sp. IMCC44359]|uniref:prolyl oligopeptidase family serine peptidase n=1 Tax=Aliikangiella sp. IMCC44359 TaxID=3459125 RepID=UPI00403AD637